MNKKLIIDPDIRLASTIHKDFYLKDKFFKRSKRTIFQNNWLYAGHAGSIKFNGDTIPINILPAYLQIPLILSRKEDHSIQCLSNVCTHRGNLLIEHPGNYKKLVCKYHGRRFNAAGKIEFMPEFKEVENFPADCDHLTKMELFNWKDLLFVNLSKSAKSEAVTSVLDKYMQFERVEDFAFSALHSKTYTVKAHWALYCENYLEGFHIPFVHKELNEMLDYGKYEVRCYEKLILQIGYADDPGICFDLPDDHPLAGEQISAFYFFLFPNVMLNFYTWGLSLNIVEPVRKNLSRIHFKTFIKDQDKYEEAHASDLIDKVEREDEYVVENVQLGIASALYQRGRYSAKRETGVHQFQRLIAEALLN